LENVVLFPCRREAEEVAAFHLLLCLWMYSSKTAEGSLTTRPEVGSLRSPSYGHRRSIYRY
jgi:hypothetical protein